MKKFSLAVYPLLFSLGLACNQKHETQHLPADSYYTCPMHPSVSSNSPGSCPVCNMSLVKVELEDHQHAEYNGNFVTLDEREQKLAGIKTDTIGFRNISSDTRLTGRVTTGEEQITTISSRVSGRIDKLFIKTTGSFLKNGSPLFSIYSEQLLADEKEFIALVQKTKEATSKIDFNKELNNAAKNKLMLRGLSEKNIDELEKSENPSSLITFYSKESGYVTEVNVIEGMYVDEGNVLFKITSLNHVWVEAQVYANENLGISDARTFQVFTDHNPGKIYTGKLIYHNPVVEDGKRIQLLKISVDDTGGQLMPGELVTVIPVKSRKHVLAVPKTAVLLEKMKTVWVLMHDHTFEQRMVETGSENRFWIEILSGLQAGEVIVTEGAYLLSSEFILKSGTRQQHQH